MKTRQILFWIVSILAFSSCTRLLLFFNGGSMPRLENEASLRAYSEKIGWDTGNIYTFRDSSGINRYFKKIGTIPWISFYNRDGYLMNVIDKGDCSRTVDSIIQSLDPGHWYEIDSLERLQTLMPTLCDLNGQPQKASALKPADFYAVIYWTVFAGKLNQRNTKIWEEMLYEKAETLGIEVFKVNCDFQEAWDMD
jgi:hypothetical protein